jgi:hypothetical protein
MAFPRKLGNIGILTEQAAKIASCGGNGITPGAWMEMKERLLFDGVDMLGDDLFINETEKRSFFVLPDCTLSSLSRLDPASLGAQETIHGIRIQLSVEHGFLHADLHLLGASAMFPGHMAEIGNRKLT